MQYTPLVLITICIIICIAIWFIISIRDIASHRAELNRADKQLSMYELLQAKAEDDPEEARTQEQVEISRLIYHNVVIRYNKCIEKPANQFIAIILGCHAINEGEEL